MIKLYILFGESNSFNPLGLEWSENYDIDRVLQKTGIKIVPEGEAKADDFVDVTSYGSNYYVFRKKSGEVWSIGYNSYGQLGVGDTVMRASLTKAQINDVKEIKLIGSTVYYLKNDGTLWASGRNKMGEFYIINNDGEDKYISPTKISYIKDGEEVFQNIKHVYVVEVGNESGAVIMKNNGEVWKLCGYNHYSGTYSPDVPSAGAHDVTRLNKIEELASTYNSQVKDIVPGFPLYVLLENGSLYSCGDNYCYQLGVGDTSRAELMHIESIGAISKFSYNNFEPTALSDSGELYLWGGNGVSLKTPYCIDTGVTDAIITSGFGQFYLKGDGKLYSADIGTKTSTVIATNIKRLTKAGVINEDNEFLTYGGILSADKGRRINLTKSICSDVKDFYKLGGATGIYEGNSGKFYAWGRNIYKIIEVNNDIAIQDMHEITFPSEAGKVKKVAINSEMIYVLDENGNLWGKGVPYPITGNSSSAITEWTKVGGNQEIEKFYINEWTLFVQKKDKTLWSAGHAGLKMLGNGATFLTTLKQISNDSEGNTPDFSNLKLITESSARHVVALMEDGRAYVWGDNQFGQLGIGTTTDSLLPTKFDTSIFPSKVIDVKSMEKNTVFLLENGDVYVTGDNSSGQLGIGSRESSLVPVKAHISNVKQIAVGVSHILAIKEDNSVWAWGSGAFGQLGTRKTQDELEPIEAYELCK